MFRIKQTRYFSDGNTVSYLINLFASRLEAEKFIADSLESDITLSPHELSRPLMRVVAHVEKKN